MLGFMGEVRLRRTGNVVRGLDRSLAVPGDIDGPLAQVVQPLNRRAAKEPAPATGAVAGVPHSHAVCFTWKRPRGRGEERWALE